MMSNTTIAHIRNPSMLVSDILRFSPILATRFQGKNQENIT